MHPKTLDSDGPEGMPLSDDRPPNGPVRLLTGAAYGIAATGAVLALADVDSPLRAPCTLFLLLVAPALAIGAALPRMAPLGRAVVAAATAPALNLLVAQTMLALHMWSVRGGVVAVTAFSGAVLLLTAIRKRARRAGAAASGRPRTGRTGQATANRAD
ncbi:hypothetical protein [Streptomyces halobius]|uniref:Integral membrane protein n=1 Tax=Streptomyces halobius TaxID=2879846 RepID=A0ABY4MF54_9ACTN|nr:hypothetical protein [Streptomyces halobius]UQA96300.1 hypothetical protein K9S39_34460 [Streptomyces halobius]